MKPVKDSVLLLAVKRRLVNQGYGFICIELDKVCSGSIKQKTEIKRWVELMLGGCTSYSAWLQREHRQTYMLALENRGSLHKGRLAWLDWMIEQCQIAEAKEAGKVAS